MTKRSNYNICTLIKVRCPDDGADLQTQSHTLSVSLLYHTYRRRRYKPLRAARLTPPSAFSLLQTQRWLKEQALALEIGLIPVFFSRCFAPVCQIHMGPHSCLLGNRVTLTAFRSAAARRHLVPLPESQTNSPW